ncbi:hypothetical protein ROG8370_01631 [Roseovarius gaetbuli]|uniref:Uncharacterized protein n=1 Tax=Roseovarius gaetbuli TaxID=1356575 RepID=A0A1X6Z3Q4_9RHOB|nr:hypothetical protein [Roseovarius gaetbuli]SLN39394.1 hypothetical protein ROG8370_01631 [Roseovarius gaetbuli]
MKYLVAGLTAAALLGGCGSGSNPFDPGATTGPGTPTTPTDPTVDPTDPNVDVNSRFLFDVGRDLTMNSVTFDPLNNQLVINNLPFDGPDQIYSNIGSRNTAEFFASRKTPTTGRIQHYAVFVKRDDLEATAAAGAEWGDFGFGGANIKRDSFNLPANGEYVYTGVYAGVRTFNDRTGLHLVTGNAELLLDINDLDPAAGLQGNIVGSVTNRTRTLPSGTALTGLPNLTLNSVTFNTVTGAFEGGTANTFDSAGDIRDSGTYEGLIAGAIGEEIGTLSVIEGVAEIQNVAFETVEYTAGGTTGTARALTATNTPTVQALVDAGLAVPLVRVETADLPTGAVITSTTIETQEFRSDFNAREIGVIGADQVIP